MLKRGKWLASHLEEVLCVFLFGLMGLILFVNIVSRYLLKFSLAFTEELVVSLFVWVTLLGSAIAFRQGTHLSFTFLTDRLPLKARKLLLWISALLGAILFALLIYFSILQIKEEVALKITSSGIGVPQWWYTIGMPIWSLLVIFRIFQGAYLACQRAGKT
ncbi:MAG: TRAP transporter small permease [Desulfobacterota bacterium]|nr:TRAP transporter small permease [Thermodesulfobacteriota bacterium]